MMGEFIVGVLLAAAAVWFVLQPIFRPAIVGDGRETGDADEGEDPGEDMSPRAVAVRALREIEFDRATGKLSDADYDSLHAKYTTEAVAALRAEGGSREGSAPAARIPHPGCPTHGPRPEPDALFCSECGRRLATAPGYCARCGTALETGARYCHACGARVAA